jgi:flagellar L-ring protein precursor FlgH
MYWLFLSVALAKKPAKPPPTPPTRPIPTATVAAPVRTPGSIWDDATGRQLLGLQGNARQVGDLVTVRISERTTTTLDANTRTARDSSTDAAISALLGAETTIPAVRPSMNGRIAVGGASATSFDGDGTTSRGATIEAMLTCEVIEVLPSGNLHVWGYKQVRVNREIQYVVLDGLLRPRDIRMDNTVSSELLAEARIEVTGGGVVDDVQGPGIGTRLIDRLWPF